MIYLLSRPDDWVLRTSDVRRFLGAAGRACGRDKSYKVLAELRQHRYLVMCNNVMDQHFAGVTYYIFDEPVKDVDEVQRRHRDGENALEVGSEPPLSGDIFQGKSPLPEKPEAGQLPLPDFPYPEKPEAIINKDNIQTTESPLTPQRRQTRRRSGSDRASEAAEHDALLVAEPWSIEWYENRLHLLRNGPERSAPKPPAGVEAVIRRGGEVGERERLAHQARHCWPRVNQIDEFSRDGRGVRVPSRLFDEGLSHEYAQVRSDGAEFTRWDEEMRLRGWPALPKPTRTILVWLPIDVLKACDREDSAKTRRCA